MDPELLDLANLSTTLLAGAAAGLVLSAFLGFCIGRRKDRPMLGIILGGLLTIPGLLAVSLMPQKEPTYY